MKHIKKFNEDISSEIENKLLNIFNDIRECFLDLEDMDMIKFYKFGYYYKHGLTTREEYTDTGTYTIGRSSIDFFIKESSRLLDILLTYDSSYNIVAKEVKNEYEYKGLLSVYINFPCLTNGLKNGDMDYKSIQLFENILEASNRLKSLGYDPVLNLDERDLTHSENKPIKFKIYFNI